MDCFPDDAQQHLKEVRRAIVRLTQSISMGNEYIRAQFARFGTQHIACCILNEACCTKIQNSDSAGYRSISSQYMRGFLLLFVRFITRCWIIFPMPRQGTYGRCLRAVKHLDGLYESTDSL